MGREHSSLTLGFSRSMHGSCIMLLFAETQFTFGRIIVFFIDALRASFKLFFSGYLLPVFLPKVGLVLGFWACQGAWFLPVFLGLEVYWSSPGFLPCHGACSLPVVLGLEVNWSSPGFLACQGAWSLPVFLGLELNWPSPDFLPCHGACSLPVVLGLEVYWPSPGFLPCHGA
jgi:hypothetical protein